MGYVLGSVQIAGELEKENSHLKAQLVSDAYMSRDTCIELQRVLPLLQDGAPDELKDEASTQNLLI